MLLPEKKALSAEQIDAQAALELPDRAMTQLVGPILVNVGDITVPVGVAANLCDINAAVLVQEFQDTGSADCDAVVDNSPGQSGAAPGRQ